MSKQHNSTVLEPSDSLMIVANDKGETPPNENMLSSIESIQDMSETQVRQCLQFYGHNDSLSLKDLFISLGIDVKTFVHDRNHKAWLTNSIDVDDRDLILFRNEDASYPQQGKMFSGTKTVELDALRDPNTTTVDQLLKFYHIPHGNLHFEKKLNLLLTWLGYQSNHINVDKNLNESNDSFNQFRNEKSNIKDENGNIKDEICNMNEKINTMLKHMLSIDNQFRTLNDITNTNVSVLRKLRNDGRKFFYINRR